MSIGNVEHRNFDEEDVEEINRLQEEARQTKIRDQVGSSERLELRLEGDGINQTLRHTEHGYALDEEGTLIKQTVDSSRLLDCGCPALAVENAKICTVTKKVICAMHTVQCGFCHQNVWTAQAEMIKEKIICKTCKHKRWKTMPFTALKKMVWTVAYGLIGHPWEENETPMPSGEPTRTIDEQISSRTPLGRRITPDEARGFR
jgi:hypothetical protein